MRVCIDILPDHRIMYSTQLLLQDEGRTRERHYQSLLNSLPAVRLQYHLCSGYQTSILPQIHLTGH